MAYSDLSDNTKRNIFDIAMNYQDIILVDVSNQLYKSYFVHSDLTNPQGFTSGHIYGFLQSMASLKNKFNNVAIVLCVDGHDNERKSIDSNYKANRGGKFNVHKDTWDAVTMTSALGNIFTVYDPDKEADDCIYAVSKAMDTLFVKNGLNKTIYIFGSDHDLYQCVTPRVKIIKKFGKGRKWWEEAEIVDIDGVKEEFGVLPEQVAKFRAFTGDTSDNLTGYFRFLKKNAITLANIGYFSGIDGDIFEEGHAVGKVVIPDKSINIPDSLKKAMDTVNSDYEKYLNNYKIMKLKDFSFELDKPSYTVGKIVELLDFWGMNQFKERVGL